MKKVYIIFAALSDEENEGWIWLSSSSFPTRTIVRIIHPENGRKVFCESRKIDDNFLRRYNCREHTRKIDGSNEVLVISEWYRDALGGFPTQSQMEFDITRARIPFLRDLRASCQHPQIAVRLGTRLGVLGAWLGILGLAAALLDAKSCVGAVSLVVIAVAGAAFGLAVCRGTKRTSV